MRIKLDKKDISLGLVEQPKVLAIAAGVVAITSALVLLEAYAPQLVAMPIIVVEGP